jgi:tetratricopeptide (TPR) repeat protein
MRNTTPTRPFWLTLACLLGIGSGSIALAAEAEAVPPQSSTTPLEPSSPRDSSLRHFENGIRLFEDRNYLGALAEFEAAYRSYPSGSSLQNVALCQKQLYRYSEARDTLVRLLELHAQQLSDAERKTVEEATREPLALVGSVRITVVPPNAHLLLDGRSLQASDLAHAISLDVGEHRITAEAEGYAPFSRSFRVAGGQADVALDLILIETTGTLEIFAPDAQTAIAIDGRPVAFENWLGRLPPGSHVVQIYKDGFEAYEEEVDLEVGDHLRVIGELGEATSGASASNSASSLSARRQLQGWYGLATTAFLAVRGHPVGFRADSDYDFGYELGMRGGYRIWTPLAIEAHISSGSFTVQGRCKNELAGSCPETNPGSYHLDTRRFGAGARWMSHDENLRVIAAGSAGATAMDLSAFGNQATGFESFMQFELGIALNYRHILWEISGVGIFQGASNIQVADYHPYENGAGIQFFGISLGAGYSEWSPTRKVPPLPKTPPVSPSTRGKSASSAPMPTPHAVLAPARTQAPAHSESAR